MLSRKRAEISTSIAGSGKQYTCFDPGFGHIYDRSVFGIGQARTQQHTCRMPAQRMPDDSDSATIQAPAEPRDRSFDEIKLIKDALHILYAGSPEQGSFRTVSIETKRL